MLRLVIKMNEYQKIYIYCTYSILQEMSASVFAFITKEEFYTETFFIKPIHFLVQKVRRVSQHVHIVPLVCVILHLCIFNLSLNNLLDISSVKSQNQTCYVVIIQWNPMRRTIL